MDPNVFISVVPAESGSISSSQSYNVRVGYHEEYTMPLTESAIVGDDVNEISFVQDMDLRDDDVIVQNVGLDGSTPMESVMKTVQLNVLNNEEFLSNGEQNPIFVTASRSTVRNEDTGAEAKRARVTSQDDQPSVSVKYNGLTKKSKKKLMELMQHWSKWQAEQQYSNQEDSQEPLEYGKEIYYPALYVGSEKPFTVSFWLDNQASAGNFVENDSVPLYDREYTLGSSPFGNPSNLERVDREDIRCFNCNSYSHSLKDCPKPRDNVAVNSARKQHSMKKSQSASNNSQQRYYQKATCKFDDLKPGVLGRETRECLGIGEHDPPPWLQRMRELGYPPGYLEVVEDESQPSGITIFGGDETGNEEYEEGELPEKADPDTPQKRMAVEFPGINAPIPDDADPFLWSANPISSGPETSAGRSQPRPHHTPDSGRTRFPDETSRESRNVILPSSSSYPPRYSPYERRQIVESPKLKRTFSDHGFVSPSACESRQCPTQGSLCSLRLPSQPPQYQRSRFEEWNLDNAHSDSRYRSPHSTHEREDPRRSSRR